MTPMKSRYHWMAVVALVAGHAVTAAQADNLVLPRLTPNLQLSQPGDMASILLAQTQGQASTPADATQDSTETLAGPAVRRSDKPPGLAFAMSAVLPGSGEFWVGAKKRAVLFFSLEVLGWGTYLSWDGKGSDLEDDFRVRADSTYNPWNYLAWRDSRNNRFSSITHALPCSSHVKSAPSSIPVPDAIADCPASDKQQFYELIGKYDQFVSGWDDVQDDGTGNRVQFTEVDSAENFQSATRLSYEVDRNESNKYLKRATLIGSMMVVNHFLSAIDALGVARARNEGQDEAVIDRRTRFGVAMGGSVGTTPMFMAYRPVY